MLCKNGEYFSQQLFFISMVTGSNPFTFKHRIKKKVNEFAIK